MKLDLKDKRILKELFYNGRMSYSKIAKNVGLSKQVVLYRINRLLKLGLLRGFNTVIDLNKLGLNTFFVHMKLGYVKDSIFETLKNHKNIMWVVKSMGGFDLTLKICTKNYLEAHKIVKSFSEIIHYNLYYIDLIEEEHPVPLPFLYLPLKPHNYSKYIKITDERFDFSNIDLNILEQISYDSRLSLSDISKKIKQPESLVRYHLKKLEKNVIVTYRPSAWSGTKSLGYSWYLIMFQTSNVTKEVWNDFVNYIANLDYVTNYYKTVGKFNFQFEIRLEAGDELDLILSQIKNILKEALISYTLSLILKEYQYTYFPKVLKELV